MGEKIKAQAMAGRNDKVQVLRALAVIAVVVVHTCPDGMYQVVFRPFVNFAVAVFLFLSGYLTNLNVDNKIAFYKKRIIRVLIPYIVWTVIYSLINGHPEKILKNLLTTNAEATLYYVFVYIQFVLIAPFLIKLIKSKWSWVGWLISPVSTVLFKYIPLLCGFELNSYLSIFWNVCCLGWFTYYYLGIMLGNNLINKELNWKKLSVIYIITIIMQMAEGYGWLLLGNTNPGSQIKMTTYLTSTVFILLAYCYLKNNKSKTNKILTVIGDCSFGIYLSHILFKRLLQFTDVYDLLPFGVNTVIIFVLSLMFVLIGRKILGKTLSRWIGLR